MRPTRAALLLASILLAACGGADASPPADTTPAEPAAVAPQAEADVEEPVDPGTVPVMTSQLTVVVYGPDDEPATAVLALDDPLSRTTGVVVPGGPTYTSIPGARHELAAVQRDSGAATRETAPLVTVAAPMAGEWTARITSPVESRYRIDVRVVHDDGSGGRASGPWETIGAGATKRWRIVYDARDGEAFRLEPIR